MTTTFSISEPREILGLIPYRMGFVPRNSVVMVSLRGARRRIGLLTRMDLPGPEQAEQLAAMLVHHLVRDEASAALLMVYSDHDDPLGADRSAVVPLFEAVRRELDRSDIELPDAWHVGPSRYRSLTCSYDCCPAEGWPVDELLSTVLGAEMTMLGASYVDTRADAMPDLRPVDAARLAEVERFAAQAAPRIGARADARAVLMRRGRWASRVMRTWRREVERVSRATGAGGISEQTVGQETPDESLWRREVDLDARAAGLLLAGMQDVSVRDAFMLSCIPGAGEEAERLAMNGTVTPLVDRLFAGVFHESCAVEPDPSLNEPAITLLFSLARQATGRRAAPPLALLGWLFWWRGNGAIALQCLETAVAADSEHRLARLLLCSLEQGMGPGWAQRRKLEDAAAV
ncbi:MAG TPA: DUF4192 domain-containing protein [Actinomycetales bacterium]|nr:DUF4192 domain-containing protein [Actinomycetales bacterium]